MMQIKKEGPMGVLISRMMVACVLMCLSTIGYSEALDRNGTDQKNTDRNHVALNDITVKRDVVYKKTKQGPLHLDLYYPDAPKPGVKYPIVVYTHGGGWNRGDRRIGETGTKRELVVALNEAASALLRSSIVSV